MGRAAKLLLLLGALLGLYALAGFFLVPHLIQRELPGMAARYGLQGSVAEVAANPFLLTLEARDLALASRGTEPLLQARRLRADLAWSSLLRRAWVLGDVRLSGVRAHLARRPDGRFALPPAAAAGPGEGPRGGAPRVLLQSLTLEDGRLTFEDRSLAAAPRLTLDGIALQAAGIGTLPGSPGRYRLQAKLPQGGSLSAAGELTLAGGRGSDGRLRLAGLEAATLWPYLQEDWRLQPPAGRFELAAAYRATLDGTRVLVLEDVDLRAEGLRLVRAGQAPAPLLELRRAQAEGGRVDFLARSVSVPKLELAGGLLRLERNPAGRLNWQDLGRAAEADDAAPWRLALEEVALADIELALEDRSYTPPVALRGTAAGRVSGIGIAQAPIAFEASLALPRRGRLAANGSVAQDGSRASAELTLAGFPVLPLQPLLARRAALELASGRLGGNARLAYSAQGKPAWRAEGRVTLEDFRMDEAGTGERFLSCRSLLARGTFALGPDSLHVEEMQVDEPGAKLEISREREFNLVQVLKPQPGTARPAAGNGAAPFPLRIDRIEVRNGVVDFADLSLVLPFSTQVEDLEGTALGVSTEPGREAVLKATGRISPQGTASAEGRVRTVAPKALTDIRVRFNEVAMPPLSPYTATFAGRKVSSGELSLDLLYRIVDGELQGQNGVVLEDFTLGERVETREAMDLPLDLAVALLKDERGRIDIAVPVRGDLDNPRFDYGDVIREALGSLVRRVVSAPFRFLGGLLGRGGAEGLEGVEFEPGSARLSADEEAELGQVVEALKKRPQLKLVVEAAYDPRRDGRALRAEGLRRDLDGALNRAPRDGPPEPIDFGDRRVQSALVGLFEDLRGAASRAAFERDYARRGAAEDAAARHRAMFERLVDAYPQEESALRALAAERARRIAEHLVQAGIPAERVATGDTRAVERKGRSVTAALQLAARGAS